MSNAVEVSVTSAGAKLGLPPGLAEYAGQVAHGLCHHSPLRSGSTRAESRRALPGDDLVPRPQWQRTRAETMNAPVADVWPWLVQLGCGRGGYYGWFPLVDDENWLERHGADVVKEREATCAATRSYQLRSAAPRMSLPARVRFSLPLMKRVAGAWRHEFHRRSGSEHAGETGRHKGSSEREGHSQSTG